MEGRDQSSILAPSVFRAGSATGEGAGGGEAQAQALPKSAAETTGHQTPRVLDPGAAALPIAVESHARGTQTSPRLLVTLPAP